MAAHTASGGATSRERWRQAERLARSADSFDISRDGEPWVLSKGAAASPVRPVLSVVRLLRRGPAKVREVIGSAGWQQWRERKLF